MPQAQAIRLFRLDQLKRGGALGCDPFAIGRDTVFAVRDGAAVRLYRNDCPHEHSPLAWRKDGYLSPDGKVIVCYAHNAHFDLGTGLCISGPCVGRSLEALDTCIDDEGYVGLVTNQSS